MANKKKIKQNELIENNIKLVEILYFIFQGQILDIDLKEFCLYFGLYQGENQYNRVIKNLITNDIIKIKKLVNTNNNVLIATAPVYNFFGLEGKTTKYSVETVTRNSYTNYIIMNKINIDINDEIQDIATLLNNNTTLLSKKRDVESCYKPFNKSLTAQGKDAKLDALCKEEKRKSKLKNIEKVDIVELQGIEYTETFQTLKERDIYIFYSNNTLKLYITDNNSTYKLSNLTEKIGIAIRVIAQQLEVDNIETLDILIFVKDTASKTRLENNFITKFKDGEKVNLDIAINKAIQKGNSNLQISYEFKSKNSNNVYKLQNIYQAQPNKVRIKIVDTAIADKHNSDLKAQALINHQAERREQKQRERIIEELRKEGVIG